MWRLIIIFKISTIAKTSVPLFLHMTLDYTRCTSGQAFSSLYIYIYLFFFYACRDLSDSIQFIYILTFFFCNVPCIYLFGIWVLCQTIAPGPFVAWKYKINKVYIMFIYIYIVYLYTYTVHTVTLQFFTISHVDGWPLSG